MEVLAGTGNGVLVVSERCSTRTLDCTNVRDLQRLGSAVFAGSAAGVHRSHDDGRSWQRVGLDDLEVWQIRAAPDDDLCAATQPAGLYRSTDGGSTWSSVEAFAALAGTAEWCVPIEPPLPGRGRAFLVDRADPARSWVGVEVGGIVSSADGGAS